MSLPAARRYLGYSMVEILICRKAVAGGHEITSLDSCNGEILIPAYQIDVVLQEGENSVSFFPEQPGTISYSCWMGMIRSMIEVTD